ncbi:regulatory protein RecX [Pseudazoarcus pumilus]|uniref:Regulatory protein RecX n=1 Tax=Pseudazoarcus pumilus TaxID=2067960 RepID=A0A2I6S9I9_9RHOO|nr:regulatory protein RecX [Pseudazoarcus pumilus]AUN95914.1 recombination regulator RecX [Pseudazoarcus pumilus]
MTDAADRLRQKALRLLALREHSRAELARKLDGLGTPDEVEATLERMAELGLQSDRRFAESWVRSKAGRFGTARLRMDLARRGIDADTIVEVLGAADAGTDIERARAVWATKFGTLARDRREWARQARFLQGRGFSTDVIAKLLKEGPDEPA